LLELVHEPSDDGIELEDEIAMRTSLCFPLEVLARERRLMHRLAGVKQEEGLAGLLLHLLLEKALALVEEDHIDLLHVEVRRDQACPAIVRIDMGRQPQGCLVDHPGGRNRYPVAIDKGIEKVGGRTTPRTKKLVEATMDRSIRNSAGIVDAFYALDAAVTNDGSVLVEEGHTDMPLAEQRGGVPFRAEHAWQGEPLLFNEAGSGDSGEDALHAGTEGHAYSQDAVARRRADRRGAVGIGKQ